MSGPHGRSSPNAWGSAAAAGWTSFGRWCAASSTTTASPTSRSTGTAMRSPTATARRSRGPWHLDALPLVISSSDWDTLEAGLVQRSRLLDAVLTDLYGPRRSVTSGVLPPQLLFAHPGYVRAARGIEVPGRHQLFLHGCDISRAADGSFLVNADWTQAPSGAGYALADRRVVAHAIPDLYERIGPRPASPWAQALRLALIDAAPSRPRNPWWWCSARASTPRRRSTRPIWPACWVFRWWRAPIWWCATASCGCGRWARSSGSTWCCAGSTPSTSIRWICVPIPGSAWSAWWRCCAAVR